MWTYRASCVKVLDGDTLRLHVDLGFNTFIMMDLRLAEVYAPELREPGGLESQQYVAHLVETLSALVADQTWPLRVTTERLKSDEYVSVRSFTRYVGWVYADERSLNALINEWLQQVGYGKGIT